MRNAVVVIGSQWGDEGKGKITNYLSQKADVVVRYHMLPFYSFPFQLIH